MTEPTPSGDRGPRVAALIAAGTAAVLLLGAVGFIFLQRNAAADRFAACREVQVGGGMKIGGPFELTASTGQRMSDADILARGPALVYFGYSFCPDVCPVDLARNVEAVNVLAGQGLHVTPVFITVDPARDTPEVMSDYASNMDPAMIGMTGSEDELKAVERSFGVVASKEEGGDPVYYSVSHTTLSYLLLPGEGTVALFSNRISGQELADRAACFIRAAGG